MNYQSLLPVIGIIQNISQTPRDCCNQMITVNTPGGINQFILNPNTVVVGSTQLRTGMPVAAFYDSSRPVPLEEISCLYIILSPPEAFLHRLLPDESLFYAARLK